MGVHEVLTPLGPARLHVVPPDEGRGTGTLVLGHGAGGGVGAPDLRAATAAAAGLGWAVVLVEQPWRVAGKRVAPAPPRLDEGWTAALAALPALPGLPQGGPVVFGGRSAGARVACRTAAALGAAAVCCLAFPLHPPGRPERSRADELLAAADRPLVVVQGERDPFGGPEEVAAVIGAGRVRSVPGDHSMKSAAAVRAAVGEWLAATFG